MGRSPPLQPATIADRPRPRDSAKRHETEAALIRMFRCPPNGSPNHTNNSGSKPPGREGAASRDFGGRAVPGRTGKQSRIRGRRLPFEEAGITIGSRGRVRMNTIRPAEGMSNREFLQTYASAGRVGLACGSFQIDKLIRRAQRLVNEGKGWSLWSHSLVFQGERADGHHWVIESDLDIHRKHIRLGAQENRISKYFDEVSFPHLAVLDFGLQAAQIQAVVREGLEMVAGRVRYS